jgi:two-component system, cell cycle sensor histidine kinase and response regulator CckA
MRPAPRLLVVDDEPMIRQLLVRALRGRGFATLEATDGETAAEILRTSPQPIDLLITDIVMPGMNGLDLAEFTAKVSPATRVLLMSGYVAAPPTPSLAGLPFLQKPFALTQFFNTIRSLLGSNTPPESFSPIQPGRR